jgi:hypothetical protein
MGTPPALVLYDFPAKTGVDGWDSFSPFVLEISRALRLAKLPFERREVNLMKLKELNPTGQLPVLGIGEEKVPDSTRILHRIEALGTTGDGPCPARRCSRGSRRPFAGSSRRSCDGAP